MGWKEGVAAVKAGDYVAARREFLILARQGNPSAQYNIGYMKEMGNGTPVNYSEALSWYERAANEGHGRAAFRIGLMYEMGKGVNQDFGEARRRYASAARKSNRAALDGLTRIDKGMGGIAPVDQSRSGVGIMVTNSSNVVMMGNITDSMAADNVTGLHIGRNIVGTQVVERLSRYLGHPAFKALAGVAGLIGFVSAIFTITLGWEGMHKLISGWLGI